MTMIISGSTGLEFPDGSDQTTAFTNNSPTFTGTVAVEALTASGNVSLDSNTLFVDSVNNNVGIGTTSPTQKLHLAVGSASTIYNRIENTAGNCYLGLLASGDTVLSADSAGNQLLFYTSATERMRIDSSGNVGIGTASPDTKLTIEGGTGAAVRVRSGGDLVLMNAANSGEIYLYCDDSGVLTVNGSLKFNSGYGSAATAYGVRAWVTFNGTGTPAVVASGNVTSITDGGTGIFTINFTTAMPDVNYCMSYSTSNASATSVQNGSLVATYTTTDKTENGIKVWINDANSQTLSDVADNGFMFVR